MLKRTIATFLLTFPTLNFAECFRYTPASPDAPEAAVVFKTRTSLETGELGTLNEVFHPKLQVQKADLELMLQRLKRNLENPLKYSIVNVWKLEPKNGSTEALPCFGDGFKINPLYGYEKQFAALFEIAGKKERARIFAIFVAPPTSTDTKVPAYLVGAMSGARYTHHSETPEAWLAKANDKTGLEAWVYSSIAHKLVYFDGYLHYDLEPLAAQQSEKNRPTALKELPTSEYELANSGVLFAGNGGIGLGFSFFLKKELSSAVIKEYCQSYAQKLKSAPWANLVSGIRCGFIDASEDPNREGKLGSLWIAF